MTKELFKYFKNKADIVDSNVYENFEQLTDLRFKGSRKMKTFININSNVNYIKIIRGVLYPRINLETPKTNKDVLELNTKFDFDNIPLLKKEGKISEFIMNKFEFIEIGKEKEFLETAEGFLFYKKNIYEKNK